MTKYRFKTKEEFKEEKSWYSSGRYEFPSQWNSSGAMNHFLGSDIPDDYIKQIENEEIFTSICGNWSFQSRDVIIKNAKTNKEFLEELKLINKSLITKEKMAKQVKIKSEEKEKSFKSEFVYMDKTVNILNVGFQTGKNVVLYGPGGHGKSEITLDYLKEKGIDPYIITMGTGMTTDRLFGGLNIPTFEASGKIEYLVENSFMEHEYVIFEEMFDAPDFILEQLKDILSSGVFRNGTQIFPIKTKFIVCCTNRTRDEFSKNMSLKALMERFPLELNVIWDNYTEITYNKLLESKFGEGEVDPVIPYLLQEYAKNGIIISPRVAVIAYTIFDECGPESLAFIAEFAKKPSLISDAIKKFESTIKFREFSTSASELIEKISNLPLVTSQDIKEFKPELVTLKKLYSDIKGLTVNDDLAHMHSQLVKGMISSIEGFEKNLKIIDFI
jgi:hypothetical protein